MNELNYARTIRAFATQYRDMMAAADALEAIGSITQAQDEATAALNILRGEVAVLRVQKDDAERGAMEADTRAVQILTDARSQADEMVNEAKRVAEASAADIRKKREVELNEVIAVAEKMNDDLANEKLTLEISVASMVNQVGELESEKLRIIAEMDKAQDQLDKLKGKFKAFLG